MSSRIILVRALALTMALLGTLMFSEVAFAANGCIIDTHTVTWDNSDGDYDAPCTEADKNSYPCEWIPWPGGINCEILVCYNTDEVYACEEEYFGYVLSGWTVPCQVTRVLTTICYNVSGEAEAYFCDSRGICMLIGLNERLDELEEEFENSNSANPAITKTREELCDC